MEEECCPNIDLKKWNNKEIEWKNKVFYSRPLYLFLHIPLNMESAITKGYAALTAKGYKMEEPAMILEKENGLFTGEVLFNIKKGKNLDRKVKTISGKFLAKAIKGEYKDAGKVVRQVIDAVNKRRGNLPDEVYCWFANCPKCAKKQGGVKIIAFARLE
ncbi:MAG: hypothetical protein JXA43_03210 [Candidatus Diapherotrites archaeon]|nr:hypothetical protein [Candidatus Diapherotrites archaeon]